MNTGELEFIAKKPVDFLANGGLDGFKTDIFLNPKFMNLISQSIPVYSFALCESKGGKCRALAHFSEVSTQFFASPGRGSYGGIQSDGLDISNFVFQIEESLRQSGAKKISVTLKPSHYAERAVFVEKTAWEKLGFKVERTEMNYAIVVSEKDFSSIVEHSVRKRIKKCLRENFFVSEIGIGQLNAAYEVIATNRLSRGYPMTMSREALIETAKVMSPDIHVFGVNKDKNLIAAAIVYSINAEIDYVFYWGDLPGFERFSPVTLLADHLYARAQSSGKKLLDLGISTVNGIPNEGLVRFKTTLGATAAPKFVISKVFGE